MDVRKMVNDLIMDIANGVSVSQVLLKAQIVAYNLGDEKFSRYIKCEQQGYTPNDTLPEYRKQKTMVKATFVIPFQNPQTVEVHCEAIEDKRIRDLLTFASLRDPLVQIEKMYDNAESEMVRSSIPVFAYPTIKSLYKDSVGIDIYSAYQCFPKEALFTIVETFKSQLLDILMQFDKKLDWKLDMSSSKNKEIANTIINNVYHINAVVANTGSGNVETTDVKVERKL